MQLRNRQRCRDMFSDVLVWHSQEKERLHSRCTAALSVWHFHNKFHLNGERHNEFESCFRVTWHLMFVFVAIIHISHNCRDVSLPIVLGWLQAHSHVACTLVNIYVTLLLPPTDVVKYPMENKDGFLNVCCRAICPRHANKPQHGPDYWN